MPITISTAPTTATRRTSRRASRPPTPRELETAAVGSARREPGLARSAWFALLLAAICFEGLGRKFMTDVPGVVFYFAKDAILVAGLFTIGVRRSVLDAARRLLRGFLPVLPLAIAWTLLEIGN